MADQPRAGNDQLEIAELAVNVEGRRPGEVAIGVHGGGRGGPGFAWVTAEEAREFAWKLLHAARDAEDLL